MLNSCEEAAKFNTSIVKNSRIGKLAADKDRAKANRVMQVVMTSVKLDIKKLKQAAKRK